MATDDTNANGVVTFSLDPGSYLVCEYSQRTSPATTGRDQSQPSDPKNTNTCGGSRRRAPASDGYTVKVTSNGTFPSASTYYQFGNYQRVKVQVNKTVDGGAVPTGKTFSFELRKNASTDPNGVNGGFGTLDRHGQYHRSRQLDHR